MSRESVSVTPGMCSNAGRWQAGQPVYGLPVATEVKPRKSRFRGKSKNATACPADQLQVGHRTVRKVEAAILAMLMSVSALPVLAVGGAVTLALNDASQVRP